MLIDLQIELNQNKELLENLMKNNCTTITDLRIKKKLIESLFEKKRDDDNCLLISGNYNIERLNKIKETRSQINGLMDERKERKSIILSNKQCINFQKIIYKHKNIQK